MNARMTRQRAAVQEVFTALEGFASAQDVHARLRAGGDPIGLSTVYRAVQALSEDGALDTVRTVGGETLYRRCSTRHHHHLRCRTCSRTVEVAGPAVERWAEEVAAEHGFAEVSHTVEITGVCSDCAASTPITG